ncbi:hypothetical protein GCM10020220_032010 [Nonomuraea rubra]
MFAHEAGGRGELRGVRLIMERGSDKHGPRLDDEQKHETEGMVRGGGTTHAEEWKEPEAMPAPGEESLHSYSPGREPGAPEGMTRRDVDVRSDLAKWLSDTHWPSSSASCWPAPAARARPTR